MGCATCGASRVVMSAPLVRQQINFAPVEGCTYTMEQLNAWLTKLICCKDKALYLSLKINAQIMNKYLGIVMSALNYPTNPCYFQNDLDIISNFIVLISGTQQC